MSGTEGNYNNSHSFVASMRIKLDNNIITNFDYHEGNSSTHDSVIVLTAIFDIGTEDNVSEAKLLSWNSNKEIKIEVTGYPYPPRTIMYHSAQYRIDNGSSTRGDVQTLSTIQVIKPRMEIIAIGEKTEKANATYVVAKQGEMRVSHDKANIKEFTTFEPDARNALTDAENITDDKTNNVGNQGWGTNNQYYSQTRYDVNTGAYTGSASTTFLQNPNSSNFTGGTYTGTWFQWEFFEKVKVSQLRIAGNPIHDRGGSPEKVRLLGSNDGSTWYSLGNESLFSATDYQRPNITVGNDTLMCGKFAEQTIEQPGSYKYYRLIAILLLTAIITIQQLILI